MSGLEDRLSLDITDALSAVARIEDAFVSAGQAFQKSIEEALGALNVQTEVTVPVEPDTTGITPAVDEALAAADTQLQLFADADPITQSIDDAVSNADPTVRVDADVSDAKDAIDSLSGETVDVGVTADTTEVQQALSDVGAAGDHAAEGTGHATEQFAGLAVASKLAAGEVGAATEALHFGGAAGVGAAAGIGAVVVVGKELFNTALDARSAQQRFNLVLGEFGERVEHIDVGGLNEDLSTFATRLGATGREIENAASKIFQLGTANGTAGEQVAETTKQIITLAGRAVALNPALGNVGDVAERALTGLARGGRFAANLGVSLTAAEISARALSDTGKTLTADLTLYEKAAAGAEIASERLGTSLSTDINAGAENVQIKLNAVKARFEEFLEAAGQPLLDPIIEGITKAEPVLEQLAQTFATVLPSVVSIAGAFADSLVPALQGLQGPAELVGTVLGGAADALEAIPGPVKTVAVSVGLLTLALQRFAPVATEAAIASGSMGTGFAAAASGLLPLTLALAGSVTGINFVKNQFKDVDQATLDWLGTIQQTLATAPDIETLSGDLDQLTVAANDYGATANKLDDPFNRLFNSGDRRKAEDAATGTRALLDTFGPLVVKAKELQEQYHLTSEAALNLARGGDEAIKSFEEQAGVTAKLTAEQAAAARATDEFWLAVDSGTATAADIANEAAKAGASYEDFAKTVAEERQPIVDAVGETVAAFAGINVALQGIKDSNDFHTFVKQQEQDLADLVAFTGNIQTLIDAGATSIASLLLNLSTQDPTKAAAFASQLVKESSTKLASDESKQRLIDAGTQWATAGAQHVQDELSGGLELAVQKAQDAAAQKFLQMPGQLESSVSLAGVNIAAELSDALTTGPAASQIPESMKGLGEDALAGFESGITGDQLVAVKIAAENAVNTVLGAFRKGFQIGSPSKVMEAIGQDVAAGFFDGLADLEGAAKSIDPVLDVVTKFHLNAKDIASATGSTIDEITKSLTDLGEAEKKITPDELLKVGDAVKALGGAKGVKDLQTALAQQVSAAFGGLGGKEISDIVQQLNTRAALQRTQDIFGVTPVVPTPGETNVVKGADATARNVINQDITVTPPPEATPEEIAGLIGTASAWAFQSVVA